MCVYHSSLNNLVIIRHQLTAMFVYRKPKLADYYPILDVQSEKKANYELKPVSMPRFLNARLTSFICK